PDLTPVKDAVRHDTEQLEKMAEIVPSLYSLIDKSTYQAILESEDDALKQLDKLEQSDKSLSGAEKAVLEKQEAALKAQLTADFKINAHVDPSKVLEFGNLNELKLVEDVLKRTKEMAEKGELDGIDKSVIDAATKALAKQAHMLGALGHLHGIAEVTLIFGALGEVMERNNVTELNNGERLNLTMMKAQQKDMQKKSNDYEKAVQKAEEQQKKAEQMQKTMGCVGKILGWVVTAVSVAAAAFTGGASLALAGVGLALAAGDEICHAVTGKSFIDEAMKPMMDAVVKPIMNFVSKVATQALEACGVSKEKAEFAGAIIGAVVTGIAMVAVAVVGGSLVKSVASKVAGVVAEQVAKFMETSLGKMLKEALANLSEKVGFEEFSGKTAAAMGRMRKSLGITDENVEKLMTRGQQVNVAFNAGSTVAQGTMDVLTAKAELNVAKKKADLKMAEFDLSVLKQLMDSALQVFADRNKALASVMQDMVSANAVELTTGQAILKNLARSV
ncbi:type III secretion system translocon subunit SctE, partial [Burkholderia sp. RF2-non_BP3]|uniref:type III secretion system translocon subunit SctE n=1 Tax=Burkholderia sp. RF2-non_BP3 TaxID=1637844 RepID=UPI000A993421